MQGGVGVPLRFSTVGGYPPKGEKGGFGWVGEEVGTRSVPDNVNGHKKGKSRPLEEKTAQFHHFWTTFGRLRTIEAPCTIA